MSAGGVSGVRLRLCVALCAAVLAFAFATTAGAASAAASTFNAHGSVEQVYVTDLTPGEQVSLLDSAATTIATRQANSLGGLLFRNVPPGSGYRVRAADGSESDPLTVMSTQAAPPSTDVYDQTIPSNGYGYLTTRDGTKLAIDVHPPQDAAKAAALPAGLQIPNAGNGPYPTLIEYSGYGYADPAGPQNGIAILANLMG